MKFKLQKDENKEVIFFILLRAIMQGTEIKGIQTGKKEDCLILDMTLYLDSTERIY